MYIRRYSLFLSSKTDLFSVRRDRQFIWSLAFDFHFGLVFANDSKLRIPLNFLAKTINIFRTLESNEVNKLYKPTTTVVRVLWTGFCIIFESQTRLVNVNARNISFRIFVYTLHTRRVQRYANRHRDMTGYKNSKIDNHRRIKLYTAYNAQQFYYVQVYIRFVAHVTRP